MRIHFTGPVRILNATEYVDCRDNGATPGRDIHIIPAGHLQRREDLYGTSGMNASRLSQCLYYEAPIKTGTNPVNFPSGTWRTFLNAVSFFFMGMHHYDFLSDRERYAGLPFHGLLQMADTDILVGPDGAKQLLSDFLNVISDQTLQDFKQWMDVEYQLQSRFDFHSAIEDLFHGLRVTVPLGGTLLPASS